MTGMNKNCRTALLDMASLRKLNAVERSRLDLHVRRCHTCRIAMERLRAVETIKIEIPELSDQRKAAIYDRLVPSVHEIALDMRAPKKPRVMHLAFAGGFAVLGAAAVLLLAVLVKQPASHTIANFEGPEPQAHRIVADLPAVMALDRSGYIDRAEGSVRFGDTPGQEVNGTFTLNDGSQIVLDDSARANFRIGRMSRVALVDETEWTLLENSEKLLSVSLTRGRMAMDFDGSSGKRLEIHTPDVLVKVKGTVFTVEVLANRTTRVSVIEGQVEVIPKAASPVSSVALEHGSLVTFPGDGGKELLHNEQRALAGEIETLPDQLVASSGRMVQFAGTPDRVKVELENRVVGYTPLTMRLPRGPINYRLSAPGMETVEARLTREQVGEEVAVSMKPSPDYRPVVGTGKRKQAKPHVLAQASADTVDWNLVTRARAAMTAGDPAFAARLLEEAAVGQSGDELVTTLSLLAECYSATGLFERSADIFDRVASLVPGTKVAQNSRYEAGRLAMDQMGDYGRARTAFTAYIASPLGGDLKETAYFSLCELYGREGVPRNALACFNDFLRTFPSSHQTPHALMWRGVLLQEVEQRWVDAEMDLITFIQAKPRHPRCEEARYRVALGRYHQGNRKGAIAMIDEYQREHPSGRYQVRVERLRRAILNPAFSKSHKSK